MATRRNKGMGGYTQVALAALGLLLLLAGCGIPNPRSSWATARAALGGGKPTVPPTPIAEPTATATPTPEQTPVVLAPTEAPTSTPAPTATPWPTATATPTLSMLMGPAVPWLTVQALTSTPRPAYVAATPAQGPAVATIPPRPFPGSAAPTWTPAPTVFPIVPGQPTPGTTICAQLRVITSTGYLTEGGRAFIVAGEVENITSQPFEWVRAVVSLYDAGGGFIATDSAFIDFSPLSPGAISPFSVITIIQSQWPTIAQYKLAFTDFFGRPFILE